jgi:tryptophan 2,3-dioxygenase
MEMPKGRISREKAYEMIKGDGNLDYELYINTPVLLAAQKDYSELCNHDELQFQIVHQVEELWMKLISFTLLEIEDYMEKKETRRVVTLFGRIHRIMRLMINQLELLETMSPKEYQEIRLQLGNGSGQESPGFQTLLKLPYNIWHVFAKVYLEDAGLSVEKIYDSEYEHCEAYVVAEAMVEFDELFQKFRYYHITLINRSIGIHAKSLKGRSVEILKKGLTHAFYPGLWSIRSEMTDAWGGTYGVKRDTIPDEEAKQQAKEKANDDK